MLSSHYNLINLTRKHGTHAEWSRIVMLFSFSNLRRLIFLVRMTYGMALPKTKETNAKTINWNLCFSLLLPFACLSERNSPFKLLEHYYFRLLNSMTAVGPSWFRNHDSWSHDSWREQFFFLNSMFFSGSCVVLSMMLRTNRYLKLIRVSAHRVLCTVWRLIDAKIHSHRRKSQKVRREKRQTSRSTDFGTERDEERKK